MKIALTGASGFVGRSLVELLAAQGHKMLLVGRNPARLLKMFPEHETCGYDDLDTRAVGCDQLVHLAVVNNNSQAGVGEFQKVNVNLAFDVACMAKRAGVIRFVNVSSIHALDLADASNYAVSKREAVHQLASLTGIDIVTVYLPMVYGQQWAGRLAPLNKLPRPVARMLFGLLAAVKPTVSVRRVGEFLLANTPADKEAEVIISDGQLANPWYRAATRIVDLVFAVSVLFFWGWALFGIWSTIKIQSPGPGLFAQRRVGKNTKEFTCYKFRTMKLGTPQTGTHEASASAINRLGRFLRSSKLDELPQAWNILRNEMTLIGPRPCLPVQAEVIEARKPCGVYDVKPGISGLAQINGIDMSDPQKLSRWDERYVALQSLSLDLKIALSTVKGGGQGDKVVCP